MARRDDTYGKEVLVTTKEIRVAIVGVGNCSNSLIQGVEYYKNAPENEEIPGLMNVVVGGYHVRDVKFVAAFDVDEKKVGKDMVDAMWASENNTIKFCEVPKSGVMVQRGPTHDGLGRYYRCCCLLPSSWLRRSNQVLCTMRNRCGMRFRQCASGIYCLNP